MPSAPPIIYIPPSVGGTPAAPQLVYEKAPAGKATLVISGVSTAGINGSVVYAGLILGVASWSTDGTQTAGASNTIVQYTGTQWSVSRGSSYSATKTGASTPPDGLTGWTVGTGTGSPTLVAASVAAPPVITA